MQRERWLLRRRPSPEFMRSVAPLDPIAAQLLYARRIDTPERVHAFLNDAPLGDPLLLPDMIAAVERLQRAIDAGEHIVVYGDYDADGVSATALLVTALKQMGGSGSAYIPNRFSESYGLNQPALERLRARGADLVVTVDCGVRSAAEVAYAGSIGLDLIISDHHSVPQTLPPAVAAIDPKRSDSAYPYADLAGVGVAYRLAEALWTRLAAEGRVAAGWSPAELLDLVALGTVADIVPLTGENRTLVRQGLERLRHQPRPGLRALMETSGTAPEAVDSAAIGYRLGPRINAAGRLRSAQLALRLLLTEDEGEARALAEELDAVNGERQRLLDEQVELAHALLGDTAAERLLIVDSPEFHEGIVGLVAGRLCEEFYRPALVIKSGAGDGEGARGSARSVPGFHITQALEACEDLLTRYGGHAGAAGLSLDTARLPDLRDRLAAYAKVHLEAEMLLRRYDVDAIVELQELSLATVDALAELAPYGEGHPEPALASLGLRIDEVRAVGRDERHLRLRLSALSPTGVMSCGAIGFGLGHLAPRGSVELQVGRPVAPGNAQDELSVGQMVDVIYRPDRNEWNGETSLQLVVQAIRPHGG